MFMKQLIERGNMYVMRYQPDTDYPRLIYHLAIENSI